MKIFKEKDMKLNSMIFAAGLAAVVASCAQVSDVTEITGTVLPEGLDQVQVTVGEQLDTLVPVVDGKFNLTVPLNEFKVAFDGMKNGVKGTADGKVYLVSPETAAISAINGVLTDGSATGLTLPEIMLEETPALDSYIVKPEGTNTENTPVEMGPNIKPFPRNTALADKVEATVTLLRY